MEQRSGDGAARRTFAVGEAVALGGFQVLSTTQEAFAHELFAALAAGQPRRVLFANTNFVVQCQPLRARLRRLPALVACYSQHLLQAGADGDGDAEAVLTDALKREWSPMLVELYGRTRGDDPRRQLALAEGWLNAHGDDPVLQRCLARLAQRNQLWGVARDRFESSLRLFEARLSDDQSSDSRAACAETSAELGRLLQQLGERDAAARCFERGLTAAVAPLPTLPKPVSTAMTLSNQTLANPAPSRS